jgi:GntR family transcriptional regulator
MNSGSSSASDGHASLALWEKVLADLRQRIAVGEIDQRFPTEQELVATYGVSRHTVREALRRLQDEGLLERRRGAGSTLVPLPLEQPLRSLYSLARSITAQGLHEHSDVRVLELRSAGTAGPVLDVAESAPVVFLERLRFAGDEPLALEESWLPADLCTALLEADLGKGALYDMLAHTCGIHVTGGRELVRAALPATDERDLLALPDGEAVLLVERVALAGDRVVEWRHSMVRGDRYRLVAEWSSADLTVPGET